jgi:hypothetical protein
MWKAILATTFQSTRDTYGIFMSIAHHKPLEGELLYSFFFDHLAKIDQLKCDFTNADKVSLIVGAINDETKMAAVKAANMNDINILDSYLRDRTFSGRLFSGNEAEETRNFNYQAKPRQEQQLLNIKCFCCGKSGHKKLACRFRNSKYNNCRTIGHLQYACMNGGLTDKQETAESIELQSRSRVNLIQEAKARNNTFWRTIKVNGETVSAFIDFGSDCSLIQEGLVRELNLIPVELAKSVILTGFLGNSVVVNQAVECVVTIAEVELTILMYVEVAQRSSENDVVQNDPIRADADVTRLVVKLGELQGVTMTITLSKNKPIAKNPYRMWAAESCSPLANPVVLVNKKGGQKRLCVDLRALNAVTVKDKYPSPRTEHLVDRLADCKYFRRFDFKAGYNQIKIHPDSVAKTAFITADGHYEYVRMPFGLVHARAVFQRAMNNMFAFISKNFREFCHTNGSRHHLNSVALPRANGQVERFNRTVLDALAATSADVETTKWDVNIDRVQLGMNSIRNQSTPAEVLLGIQLSTNGDRLRANVAKRLEANRSKQDAYFNKKRKAAPSYLIGDKVLVKVTSYPADGESKKLKEKFKGPFTVVEVIGNDQYKVKEELGSERCRRDARYAGTIGAEHLRPYVPKTDDI